MSSHNDLSLKLIRPEDLAPSLFEGLAADLSQTYYWTPLFDEDFYIALARAGFISVAHISEWGELLLPELQAAYAVLDWKDLKASRSTQKLLDPQRMASMDLRFEFSQEASAVNRVLDALEEQWGASSWLLPSYRRLMENLVHRPSFFFALEATRLWVGDTLVAGELGYTTGAVYTSLSGFFKRGRTEWNGLGIVQLQVLARHLESASYRFWNLGHPYMKYKRDLGAKVLPRLEFLERWKAAIEEAR